ncbi:MAG TPA: MotA/TolQ/ExbB proton channel family protein [Salinisphaeraceae bacterium]|nr:MotA/TolQ/ExbB proton channel family protein [Salinisphaeraceae bacterium]
MVALVNFFDAIRGFIELGGNVLWAILVVLLMMWIFIIERYWYYFRVLPGQRREIVEQWVNRRDRQSWHAGRIREELISRLSQEMQRNVKTINTLIAVCPLLGLLGTVTGMVAVFDVMAFFGTGNARAMAAGVSQATIPTMAGMVAAISGLYFGTHLERKQIKESERLEDLLRFD